MYPNLTLANRQVGHGLALPTPFLPESIDDVLQFSRELNDSELNDEEFQCSYTS